jgi:uncharacterized protein with NRDE domain
VKLTLDFLVEDIKPEEYFKSLNPDLNNYNGFNLLLGNIDELYYFSNMNDGLKKLEPGIYGLSNALLDTPWPKVEKSKQYLKKIITQEEIHPWEVLNILHDTALAKDEILPDTGVGLELERLLSPVFTRMEKYGTRCSTVVMVDKNNNVKFIEKTYFANSGTFSTKEYNFTINKK